MTFSLPLPSPEETMDTFPSDVRREAVAQSFGVESDDPLVRAAGRLFFKWKEEGSL